MSQPILEFEDVSIRYRTSSGDITAVSNATFSIDEGDHFGLVGESGSGKSTLAKSVFGGLDENGYVASGTIKYKGKEIQDLSEAELSRDLRWKEISVIPQGSMNSLDPLDKLSTQAIEIAEAHSDLSESEALERIRDLFEVVGLPRDRIYDFPHQFSGGMKQRATIALSLFLEPSLIIADEPTTALDVIMQDQIFKYIDQLQEDAEISMLLITHDISVVFEACDNMAVMHAGQVAETGGVSTLYETPRHPYTLMLQQAFPDIRYPDQKLEGIGGHPPQLREDVDFCGYAERCPWSTNACQSSAPPLVKSTGGDSTHKVACFHTDEVRKDIEQNPSVHQD